MKLIIGLGNPGGRYKNNRHNAGHLFVDFLRSQGDALRARKTDCFMNDSGVFVKKAINRERLAISDLYVAHDDLDLKLGAYKIQLGVGQKVHNGVTSAEEVLGAKDFWRIRIGVDNRDPNNRIAGEDYVLHDFEFEELEVLNKVFDEIHKELTDKF